ncbi:putative cleavage and polyadenylation specificity factor, putative [Acanthamoeba castellanii str. Neff]|uniref:Putative cleavage and polyadenylation specificity factor, putative n=1 Tax=Acanthamoeba castellanii (strain ATCC 30010 / Neff) TaxID=1257118 RepID=L8GVC6_ACACF|nr:putative cleavage and polyadenylation specificity factor, putative [Acanthamoeba castellanii str. Neff]ELR16902.1 putative cleavage and polyadenylation specificity factor, putative [Acanthamoeba castellanii str. Neff]
MANGSAGLGKRKAEVTLEEEGDILEIMPIGAGSEVGRSCILLKFKGKHIMLDCGIHPAYTGLAALPYFDMIDDPATIDLLLVSHFHLDHCASLPYFMEKSTFKGRVYMTHPTKAIYKMLLTDFVKVRHVITLRS